MFDSGIGGLTVLRELRVLMPERSFIYVADDAGFPYGGWAEPDLKDRVIDLLASLLRELAAGSLRHCLQHGLHACGGRSPRRLPRHGVRRHRARHQAGSRAHPLRPDSVLATPGTVKRAYTRDLIQSFASQCHVRLVGSENLARMAEAYIRGDMIADAEVMPKSMPASTKRMASKPISWCWPARIIPSWPMCSAGLHPGPSIGSTR